MEGRVGSLRITISTDVIAIVVDVAWEANAVGKSCALTTLNVKNALNFASKIMDTFWMLLFN